MSCWKPWEEDLKPKLLNPYREVGKERNFELKLTFALGVLLVEDLKPKLLNPYIEVEKKRNMSIIVAPMCVCNISSQGGKR